MNKNDTILLHDCFEIRGGGERMVLVLSEALRLDLCYGYWSKASFSKESLKGIKGIDLSAYSGVRGWRKIKQIRAFRTKTQFLGKYKNVIYSGVDSPFAVQNHLEGNNIFYCHTPPRLIYDQRDYFMAQMNAVQKPILNILISYLKARYEAAISKMDIVIANSENIKKRINKHLGVPSVVVYPPCDLDRFKWKGQGDYYLSNGRLEELKRVHLIVEAFKLMPDKKLIVTSGGSLLPYLKKTAEGFNNIFFTGWASESKLKELIGNSIATIYIPVDEDFGMSPVESMAAGKPVIGVAEGGLMETVVAGKTGVLIQSPPTAASIIEAIHTLTPKRSLEMRDACEARAKKFSDKVFVDKMRKIIYSCS